MLEAKEVHAGSFLLYAYSAMSLLVLGHYLYAPIDRIAFRIHFFILLEATLAIALFAHVVVRQSRAVREGAHVKTLRPNSARSGR